MRVPTYRMCVNFLYTFDESRLLNLHDGPHTQHAAHHQARTISRHVHHEVQTMQRMATAKQSCRYQRERPSFAFVAFGETKNKEEQRCRHIQEGGVVIGSRGYVVQFFGEWESLQQKPSNLPNIKYHGGETKSFLYGDLLYWRV